MIFAISCKHRVVVVLYFMTDDDDAKESAIFRVYTRVFILFIRLLLRCLYMRTGWSNFLSITRES